MGRQSENRSLFDQLLPVLLVLVIGVLLNNESSNAQEPYKGDYYLCSNETVKCSTFSLYRAQKDYTTLTSIGALFNTNSTTLAALNALPADGTLTLGQPVVVPLTCVCSNGTTSANFTHIIASGDSYFKLNMNAFESLSTVPAIIRANPTLNSSDLTIGTPMIFPLRCSCPNATQISVGVKSLVTYPVVNGDSISQIATDFGVSTESILFANELQGPSPLISTQTTLLIPISSATPNYTGAVGASAPAAEGPTSASGRHSNSKTGGYVVIAVWFLLALSI